MVLGGEDDRLHLGGFAVDVAHRHLRLGVGPQPGKPAVLAHFGLALHEAVGVVDGQRHEHRGFRAGVAEHEALVAGALVERIVESLAHALGDVGRLAVDGGEDGAGLVVEADVGIIVADAADDVLRDLAVVGVRLGGDLAGDDHQPGGDEGLAGDAPVGVFAEDDVEHAVGDLVGDLVRVPFRDGFGGEEVFLGHAIAPFDPREAACRLWGSGSGRRFSGISCPSL